MYILYSLLLGIATLLSLPWWLVQMARLKKYRAGLRARLGAVPERLRRHDPGCIWIHAVSVGEVLAITQLVAELKTAVPNRQILVSTTTATGQELAKQRFGSEQVFFLPLDFPHAVRRYVRVLRPRLLVLAETEFWPNLLHLAKQSGAAVSVVNARISDRSFPRYRRFRSFFSRVLRNVDLFLAQTQEDAHRLTAIGAAAARVAVSGNLKFDIRLSSGSALADALRKAIAQDSAVFVCGSTTEGEEQLLLPTFRAVFHAFPSAVIILAPRHPERFNKVAELLEASDLNMVRRSRWGPTENSDPLKGSTFLLDSVGELASIYQLADVAFVGGSLAPTGGHNILEPAQHGVPVLSGPYTFNFREIVRIFVEGGALRVVDAQELPHVLLELLENPEQRESLGRRARELFVENTGATRKTVDALARLLDPGEVRR